MGMAKKVATESPSIPVTAVETDRAKVLAARVVAPKAVAYGRELSAYELEKDRRIGVAGVVQAVIGSDWYAQIAALTDLNNKEAVMALRALAAEEVDYWLAAIRERSA